VTPSISNSTVLPTSTVLQSMAVLSGFWGLPHKNLVKRLEGAKVGAWIDSMRASSPTRTKSESQEKRSWIVSTTYDDMNMWFMIISGCAADLTLLLFHNCLQLYHPSALNTFEQITYNSKGKQIVVFLDYDGTLSPIVTDPDKAFMSRKVFVFFPLVSFIRVHTLDLMWVINSRLNFFILDESDA